MATSSTQAKAKRPSRLKDLREALVNIEANEPDDMRSRSLVGTIADVPPNYWNADFARQHKDDVCPCRIVGYVLGWGGSAEDGALVVRQPL